MSQPIENPIRTLSIMAAIITAPLWLILAMEAMAKAREEKGR
jgi:hypothetical protein